MAIEVGIRHIDTAQMYGNEGAVGQAIKDCGIPRSDLFVVSKIQPSNLSAARFLKSAEQSVADLGGPVDLLLIHWPSPAADFDQTIARLIDCKARGLTASIGVSNFNIAMMTRAQDLARGAIINNQVEFHPLLDQKNLLAAAQRLNITLSAYSPIARGAALQPKTIQDIAAKYARPPSEIVLRWITQQGVCAIPMTTKRANAESNLRSLNFDLLPHEMAAISALGTKQGRTIAPSSMAGTWDA
jgi:2,5-diketo-D-gluconate reductase B